MVRNSLVPIQKLRRIQYGNRHLPLSEVEGQRDGGKDVEVY